MQVLNRTPTQTYFEYSSPRTRKSGVADTNKSFSPFAKMATLGSPTQYRPRSRSTPAPIMINDRRLSNVSRMDSPRGSYISPTPSMLPPLVPVNTPIMATGRGGGPPVAGSQLVREQQLARMAGRVLLRHWAVVLSMRDDHAADMQQVHARPGATLTMPPQSQALPGSWQCEVAWELRARVLSHLWPRRFQPLMFADNSVDDYYDDDSSAEEERTDRRSRRASRRPSRESRSSPAGGRLFEADSGYDAVSAACPVRPLSSSAGRAQILDRLDATAEYFIRELRWEGLEQRWLEDLEQRQGGGGAIGGEWEEDAFEEDSATEGEIPVDMLLPSGGTKRVYVVDPAAGGRSWSRRPSMDPSSRSRRPSMVVDLSRERPRRGSVETISGGRSRRSSRLLPELPLRPTKSKRSPSEKGVTEKELHQDVGCDSAWTA